MEFEWKFIYYELFSQGKQFFILLNIRFIQESGEDGDLEGITIFLLHDKWIQIVVRMP